MKYFSSQQFEQMKKKAFNWKIDGVLERYFSDKSKWGANVVLFDKHGNVDTIELCKLSNVTAKGATWTHYATIGVYKSKKGFTTNGQTYWELYSQFNGVNGDELWVLAYYKNFGDAARRVAMGIEKLKPIKVY